MLLIQLSSLLVQVNIFRLDRSSLLWRIVSKIGFPLFSFQLYGFEVFRWKTKIMFFMNLRLKLVIEIILRFAVMSCYLGNHFARRPLKYYFAKLVLLVKHLFIFFTFNFVTGSLPDVARAKRKNKIESRLSSDQGYWYQYLWFRCIILVYAIPRLSVTLYR